MVGIADTIQCFYVIGKVLGCGNTYKVERCHEYVYQVKKYKGIKSFRNESGQAKLLLRGNI